MRNLFGLASRAIPVLLSSTLLLAPGASCAEETGSKVLFILDASGSMNAKIYGETKIAIAKRVMAGLIRDLPDAMGAGLEIYGHRQKGECTDIEVVVPVARGTREAMAQQIASIVAKGMTPISRSLEVAGEQLRNEEGETAIVLVSDGQESCKADPCATVENLRRQGMRVKVHVVGFDVKEEERAQLQCIARAGGGQYFAADSADQLGSALKTIRQQITEAPREAPKVAPQREVIRLKMPETGTIAVPNVDDSVDIVDQASGERKGRYYPNGEPVRLAPGTYRLVFLKHAIDGVELTGGDNVVIDGNQVFGRIDLADYAETVDFIDEKTGKMSGRYYPDMKATQVPVGTYRLEFGLFRIGGVEVKAGQTTSMPADSYLGSIAIPKANEIVEILDQKTGERKGKVYPGGKAVQVPAGTYRIKFRSQDLSNVALKAGQELVIE